MSIVLCKVKTRTVAEIDVRVASPKQMNSP